MGLKLGARAFQDPRNTILWSISDDEFVPGWELGDDDDWNSDEELSEYEEEEMEQLTEAADIMKPTPFEDTARNWKKIEANQNLGYNGQSKRTQERRRQQEQMGSAAREEAKVS